MKKNTSIYPHFLAAASVSEPPASGDSSAAAEPSLKDGEILFYATHQLLALLNMLWEQGKIPDSFEGNAVSILAGAAKLEIKNAAKIINALAQIY